MQSDPVEQGRVPIREAVAPYPKYIDELAVYLGKLRDLYTAKIDHKDPLKQRAKDSNTENVNILGARGELVFLHFLYRQGFKHTTPTLLNNGPAKTCDVVVGGRTIDVKSVRTTSDRLLVRADQHRRAKAEFYVIGQVLEEQIAYFWTFRYKDISRWPVDKDLPFAPAHALDIAQIVSRAEYERDQGVVHDGTNDESEDREAEELGA